MSTYTSADADQPDPAELRERIAVDIEALEFTRPLAAAHVRDGGTVDYTEGYDTAIRAAARIARRGGGR